MDKQIRYNTQFILQNTSGALIASFAPRRNYGYALSQKLSFSITSMHFSYQKGVL